MHFLYKPEPVFYIANWLLHHNHLEYNNPEISGMNVSIHPMNATIGVPKCVKLATEVDAELQILKRYIIRGWPHVRE